jgi:hypothetical protein
MSNPYEAPRSDLRRSDAEVVAQGEASVRRAAWALIALSLVIVLVYVARVGTARLPPQVVRLLLTIGLADSLVRGRWWARWLTVLLVFFGVLSAAQQVWSPEAFRPPRVLGTLILVVPALVYLWVGRLMLWSPSVSAFFRNAGDSGSGAAS